MTHHPELNVESVQRQHTHRRRLRQVPPDQYRASFVAVAEIGALPSDLAAKIAPSAGLRNILVHQYLDADLEIVAASVGQATDDYAAYVRAIAAWLNAQATDSDTSG